MNLAYSELTNRVYIVQGKKKTDVTDDFFYLLIIWLRHLPFEIPENEFSSVTKELSFGDLKYEVTLKKIKPESTTQEKQS